MLSEMLNVLYSSIGKTETKQWAELPRNRGSIPGSCKNFSLLNNVYTGSVAHPVPIPVGAKGMGA
jgi:hypothetical protein